MKLNEAINQYSNVDLSLRLLRDPGAQSLQEWLTMCMYQYKVTGVVNHVYVSVQSDWSG